jgi:hypothetical protein
MKKEQLIESGNRCCRGLDHEALDLEESGSLVQILQESWRLNPWGPHYASFP